ncbi:jg8588 [Pararge aegeria aegeria]|uniref:Jg8588 protein n=1 Tax=Pararge aegeria aegeria TaxID=348720 RepID=A0A8S4RJL9_9NEOP|nr:jg8588 [Pararge aegeria aegeria]
MRREALCDRTTAVNVPVRVSEACGDVRLVRISTPWSCELRRVASPRLSSLRINTNTTFSNKLSWGTCYPSRFRKFLGRSHLMQNSNEYAEDLDVCILYKALGSYLC